MKIILPIYYTQLYKTKKSKTFLVGLNWYRNVHYILNNKVKSHYHELVKEQISSQKYIEVSITYLVYVKRKNTDGHNIRSILEKYILDALVENKVIQDDSVDYVKETKSTFLIDKENPRIEVIIKEYENNQM